MNSRPLYIDYADKRHLFVRKRKPLVLPLILLALVLYAITTSALGAWGQVKGNAVVCEWNVEKDGVVLLTEFCFRLTQERR